MRELFGEKEEERNSQGKDLGTLERNSQEKDPSTVKRRKDGDF